MGSIAEIVAEHLASGVDDLERLRELVATAIGRDVSIGVLRDYRSYFRRWGAEWRGHYYTSNRAAKKRSRQRPDGCGLGELRADMRCSAKVRGLPFSITLDELRELFAPMMCSLTGRPLTWTKGDGAGRQNPWRASGDQIVPGLGYIPGNVRPVCFAANVVLQAWGVDTALPLARAALTNRETGRIPGTDAGAAEVIMRARSHSSKTATLVRTSARNKHKGQGFDLPIEWVREQLARGTCVATGLSLTAIYGDGPSVWHPLNPSIDVIRPGEPVSVSNARLTCVWFNLARNAWPDEVFWEAAAGFVAWRPRQGSNLRPPV